MTSRLLQTFGALALVALVGGSIAALAVVKDRLDITIAEEQNAAQRGPDPIELLRADVAELRGELGTLGAGIPEQLQVLHDALDGAAGEREQSLRAELAELRHSLAALQQRADQSTAEANAARAQLHEALAQLGRGVNELSTAVASAASKPAVIEVPIALLEPVAPVATEPVTPVVPEVVPEVAPALEAPPAAEPPKKGFLSFKVSSQGFRFDGRQRLSIVPSLSRVGFDAKSTLHDFSGVTQKVEGELTVDLSKPGDAPQGKLTVDSASLDTGLADRDTEMRKLLEPQKHAGLVFEWTGFADAKVDAAAQLVSGTALGKLTIHGTSREVSMPVRVSVDASKRVSIEGECKVKISDFGMKPPSQLGLISVEDELKLWIALRARTLGPAGAAK